MNKQEARKFIRSHIRKRGHQSVTVTDRLILKWWHIFNVAVFHGQLHKPYLITITKLRKAWAWAQQSCIKGQINIIICPTFKTRKLFLSVLIHEMVHAWEMQHHSKMGHGKRFFKWGSRIKWTTGLVLSQKVAEG